MTTVDLTTDQQSSTLDEPDEEHQCQAYIVTTYVLNGTALPGGEPVECPKAATQHMLFTCCGTDTYACDEHAFDMPQNPHPDSPIEFIGAMQCPSCGHVCRAGVCYHVVTTPLH